MLEPNARLLYLDELRPPEGYSLDRAVATTYSLDLLALLMAPFSMALAESREEGDLTKRPMALLAALRRTAGRLVIFCQKGRIAVPKQDQILYSYLEQAVVEVQPPGQGAFHPKIWVLRFVKEDAQPFYRLICLSRNLTFDTSWDTVLTLEGEVAERRTRGFARNRELAQFVAALPSLATAPPDAKSREHVQVIADEVRRVAFRAPEGFRDGGHRDDVEFCPMGAWSKSHSPDLAGAERLLVVSPFLSDAKLSNLAASNAHLTLVSRAESLDALSDAAFRKLAEAEARIYAMDEGAEHPNEVAETEPADEGITEDPRTPESEPAGSGDCLSGLHAKLYVAEYGAQEVHLWTGSANATSAAFNGQNVEFMVGLWGRRRDIGIDKLLGEEGETSGSGATSFIDLLTPYVRPETAENQDETEQELQDELERHRRLLAAADLQLTAKPRSDEGTDLYDLVLELASSCDVDEQIAMTCVPITLPPDRAHRADKLFRGESMVFGNLPSARLTRFLAFRLEARAGKTKASLEFVLKVMAKDFPEDRDAQILRSIISNTEQFLKYLLYLLGDGDMPPGLDDPEKSGGTPWKYNSPETGGDAGLPLFEYLVKASSRSPEKIEQVNAVIQDIQEHSDDKEIIPEDFLKMWAILYSAYREKVGS